jgi:hypothetical protein
MLLSRSFNACKVLSADAEARIPRSINLTSLTRTYFVFAVLHGQRQQQCNQQARRYVIVLWPCALVIYYSCAWIHALHMQLYLLQVLAMRAPWLQTTYTS